MNALANDQMKRLRQVLAGYPHITFGRYTGDTEDDPKRARDAFGELNIGEPMLPNELLSRQEMRATPPHLLLTNYAMLEYLLLRPRDMDLFAAGEDSQWRFIVVDEAHVYDGSQGAEIAMLLRRVRDRVASRPADPVHRDLGHGGRRRGPARCHRVRLATCSASPSSGSTATPTARTSSWPTRVAMPRRARSGDPSPPRTTSSLPPEARTPGAASSTARPTTAGRRAR